MNPDDFSQLRPFLGDKVDQLQIAYVMGSEMTKRHIDMLLVAITARLGLGITPPSRQLVRGRFSLGDILVRGKPAYPLELQDADLFHMGFFGQTGRGKTNAVLVLLQQLSKQDIPWMVFDWKRAGYRDLLSDSDGNVSVYTVGRDVASFFYNPLIPPSGVDDTTWVKRLIQCLSHAYFLGHGCEMILQDVMHPKQTPTLRHVLARLQVYPAKWRKLHWLQSTERAIKALCYGGIDKVLNCTLKQSIPMETLLKRNVVFELDALTESEARFFVDMFLSAIYEYRKQSQHSELQHVCVIEEAHHVLAKQEKAVEAKSVLDKLFREIREYGEALVVVDQMPSSLLDAVLANLATQVSFTLQLDQDVQRMGDAMLLKQSERYCLGRLPVGVALVKLQNRWHAPFLVHVPLSPVPKRSIADANLAKHAVPGGKATRDRADFTHFSSESLPMPQTALISPASLPDKDIQIEIEVRAFLRDIVTHPFSHTTKRYQRLKLNPRRGNQFKQRILQTQLARQVQVTTDKGVLMLLELTRPGRERLKLSPSNLASTSLEHRFWQDTLARRFSQAGYTVRLEVSLPTGGRIDLVAEKEGRQVAVEVETGKSNVQANVAKCHQAGFTHIVLAATSRDALCKLEPLKLKGAKVVLAAHYQPHA